MSEVAGRPVKAIRVGSPGGRAGHPQSSMARMFDYYDQHSMLGNALTLRAILGREPRTLRAYFEELAVAAPVHA